MRGFEKSKLRVISSIVIDKDIETVWNILTNISDFSRWNPLIKHAAIYGPIAQDTRIKATVERWDFDLEIGTVRPSEEISLVGKTIGIRISLLCKVTAEQNKTAVEITASAGGWIAVIFKKKAEGGLQDFIDLFLSSLEKKALKGESYELKMTDDSQKEEESGIRMPTPFNLIYRTRTRKFRKGGSGLK